MSRVFHILGLNTFKEKTDEFNHIKFVKMSIYQNPPKWR